MTSYKSSYKYPVITGKALCDASDPMPGWDVALTAICRSQLYPAHEPLAAVLADYPDCEDILDHFEILTGFKEKWPSYTGATAVNLCGIQVCMQQLSRFVPLETIAVTRNGLISFVPANSEILRIKCSLIVMRNSARDYVDLAFFSSRLGFSESAETLKDFDRLFDDQDEERLMLVQLIDSSALRFLTIFPVWRWNPQRTFRLNGGHGTRPPKSSGNFHSRYSMHQARDSSRALTCRKTTSEEADTWVSSRLTPHP
ncbi:MAG: hypothetical protein LBT40_09875 [Deltaproteobacteria bacterium]|jgi:hypothetical protein|nr:hypothetical protein [Deltaproteobacteria bacterium]